jgi:hypothetical protein
MGVWLIAIMYVERTLSTYICILLLKYIKFDFRWVFFLMSVTVVLVYFQYISVKTKRPCLIQTILYKVQVKWINQVATNAAIRKKINFTSLRVIHWIVSWLIVHKSTEEKTVDKKSILSAFLPSGFPSNHISYILLFVWYGVLISFLRMQINKVGRYVYHIFCCTGWINT